MKQHVVRDLEKLYDQTLQFLEGEGMSGKATGSRYR